MPRPDTVGPRAQKLRFQGLANRVIRGLLRTPLICRVVGRSLVTVSVVGRKSGTCYVIPVAYTLHEGALLIGTPFGWVRNLRTGTPVTIRWKGKVRQADVEVFTREPDVVRVYTQIIAGNRTFASFNKIGLAADGTPSADDLHLAWESGARAVRLTPR